MWVKAVGVKLEGLKEFEQELNMLFSPERVQRIIDKALVAGGRKMVHMIKQEQAKYRETGSTVSEATLSDPMTVAGKRIVKVHWRGPKNRYAVIYTLIGCLYSSLYCLKASYHLTVGTEY